MIEQANMPEGQERAVVNAETNLQDEVEEFLLDHEEEVKELYEKKLWGAKEGDDEIVITGRDIEAFTNLVKTKSIDFLLELRRWEAHIPAYDECTCKYCDNVHNKPIDSDMFGEYFEWERND